MIPAPLHKHMGMFDRLWKALVRDVHILRDDERLIRMREIALLDQQWLKWPEAERREAFEFYYKRGIPPLTERKSTPVFPAFKEAF